jgi:hypothetical protein
MKINFTLFILLTGFFCFSQEEKLNFLHLKTNKAQSNGLIIIIPGLGERINDLKNNSLMVENCLNNEYDVLLLELHGKFFLEDEDLKIIYNLTENIIETNSIKEKIIIGGFSIGGNLAMNYCVYTYKNQKRLIPEKIFILDSPVDLYKLYSNSKKFVSDNKCLNDFKKEICYEDNVIINLLEFYIGNEDKKNIYEKNSFYSENLDNENLKYLSNFNILFFSDNNESNYQENTFWKANYHSISKMYDFLKSKTNKKILLELTNENTKNQKDYHPHSWLIVNFDTFFDFVNQTY